MKQEPTCKTDTVVLDTSSALLEFTGFVLIYALKAVSK
jgi:hypothetical protein